MDVERNEVWVESGCLLDGLNPPLSPTVDKNRLHPREAIGDVQLCIKGDDPALAKHVLNPGIIGIVFMC